MMPGAVDPRAWNIFAGLCLASGCGGRVIGADTSGTETADSSESITTVDDPDGSDGPECVTSLNCGYSYECYDGECVYVPQGQDGHNHDYAEGWDHSAECFYDADCSTLEICDAGFCQEVWHPSACRPPDPDAGLMIPVASLALSFADVDDDGAEELVVATVSELHVYESGSDVPLISPRGLESETVDAMAAAAFDATPGEDVVILYADELRRHASDGAGNFAAPSVSPSSWSNSVGLLAGELDGAAPADTLIWASSGAGVELASGASIQLSNEMIASAIARPLAEPAAGFALQRSDILYFFTSGGASIGTAQMRGSSPPFALTSITQLGEAHDLSSSVIGSDWTMIEQWRPASANLDGYSGVLGQVTAMAGGDFDGDAQADVALIIDGSLQVQFGVLSETTCLALYPFESIATNIVVGDHDGDLDGELAIRFEGGNVAVIDAE
jgi:hypothetical protein